MALDLGKFTTEMRAEANKNPVFARMALMMEQVQDAINQQGNVLGVDSTQHNDPPDPPTDLNVKASNGTVHVTINDPSPRGRSRNYFVEADTDPAFGNAHVEQLSASRGKFFSLPGNDDNNVAQPWYFRAYSMELGSQKSSAHVYFGGQTTPTPVTVGGAAQLTPLPSTGSGTASTSGQQGGTGFGTAQFVSRGDGSATGTD